MNNARLPQGEQASTALLLPRIRAGDWEAIHAFYLLTAWDVLEYLRCLLPEDRVAAVLPTVYARAFQEIAAGCDPPNVTDWLLTLAEAQCQSLVGEGMETQVGMYAKLKS